MPPSAKSREEKGMEFKLLTIWMMIIWALGVMANSAPIALISAAIGVCAAFRSVERVDTLC